MNACSLQWSLMCLWCKQVTCKPRIIRLMVRYGSTISLEKKTWNLLQTWPTLPCTLFRHGLRCRAARNQDGRENQFTVTLSSAFKMRWCLPGGRPSKFLSESQPSLEVGPVHLTGTAAALLKNKWQLSSQTQSRSVAASLCVGGFTVLRRRTNCFNLRHSQISCFLLEGGSCWIPVWYFMFVVCCHLCSFMWIFVVLFLCTTHKFPYGFK